MGHVGESDVDASWALNAPEKIRDYGWRANHVGAETAKQVIAAFTKARSRQVISTVVRTAGGRR